MTKRERFLLAMRNQPVGELIWSPNFDYWLLVNSAEDTLPERYRGMSRNDIVRAIGGYIWNRVYPLRAIRDRSVREKWQDEGPLRIHTFHTPVGSIREVYAQTEGEHRSKFVSEHFIKDMESLAVMKYVVEAAYYEVDHSMTHRALEETGDDGIVLNPAFCVPFIQFAKTDAGYMNGFYMWMDHRDEVDSLIAAYFKSFLQGYRALCDGTCDAIITGDNMDGVMISPEIFKEYAVPFYQEAKKICAVKGKIFEGHWCGRTQRLLPLTPGCGLDVVEAIVTEPMAAITITEALDALRGEVVMQGGIPSVLVCEEGCDRSDFERYIIERVLPVKKRGGFILGMSDNVPPNADFTRVESVARLIA